jgi:adenylate cyclase class IV
MRRRSSPHNGYVAAPRRNVELKATDPDRARSIDACRALDAEDMGTIWQRDSYFAVPHGGLKLREEHPGRPHLIQFSRTDEPQQRESRYRIIDVDDAQMLLAALSDAIGLTVVVSKCRHLFLWQGVRIHLDEVEQLGTFIELEAVAPPESDLSREHRLIEELRTILQIKDERLVGDGYARQLTIPNSAPPLT